MSAITTHVLDTSLGRPAAGVLVLLEFEARPGKWKPVGGGTTDADGRLNTLLPRRSRLSRGTYRLTFDTAAYFRARAAQSFYPNVTVVFTVRDPGQQYHIPLLLSPYGYSTYRGS